MSDDIGGVCLVTQPERSQKGKEHAADLAAIISQLTSVAVLTANLPDGTRLERENDVVEYASAGTGERLLVEIVRFVRNQLRLCLAIQRRPERVVLFFGTTSYLLPVVYARLLGKRVVVLPRGDVPLSLRLRWEESMPAVIAGGLAGLVRTLEQLSYTTAHAVVTYTPAMAAQLGLDRYEDKLHTNGARFVDTDQFDVRTPFSERDAVVGFIGRLDVEKRVPELAEAAKRLPDDVRFVFVGDGEYRDHLEETLAEDIERGRVDVVGWVDRDEVPAQLNRMRLLVVPSHPTEGLPTAILESMACGTPAYATPVAGVPDVVRDGETGFLLDDVDPSAIAEDVETILDRENLAAISADARGLITAEYSFEAAVQRYDDILTSVS